MILIVSIVVAFLLLEPAYYRLRSKNRNTGWYLWPSILLTGICLVVELVHPDQRLVVVALLSPLVVWMLSRWLPGVPGAPGAAYLRVNTVCPHCQQTVSFDRREQGNAALCPACSEIMDVPHEQGEDRPRHKVSAALHPKGAWTTLFQNLNPAVVELQRMRLDAAGIPSFEADACTACADPVLAWAGGGVRLMVQEQDLSRAHALFESEEDAFDLPDDFESEAVDETPPVNDGSGLFVLEALVLLLILPAILAGGWKFLGPSWGISDAMTQAQAATYRFTVAFRMCLVVALIRWAFVVIKGRALRGREV